MRHAQLGFTLVELIATLAILGVIGGVAGAAMITHRNARSATQHNQLEAIIARIQVGRREAIALRHVVVIPVEIDGTIRLVTALPDGRVVAEQHLRSRSAEAPQ